MGRSLSEPRKKSLSLSEPRKKSLSLSEPRKKSLSLSELRRRVVTVVSPSTSAARSKRRGPHAVWPPMLVQDELSVSYRDDETIE